MKYKQLVISIFFCICLCILGFFYAIETSARDISILTNSGAISYSVEVADTPSLQQKGLMYRQNMQKNQGMLFVFKQPKIVSMWMKNTYIPLDMLFADESGTIQYIYENARPLDETVITCPVPIKYVIELNAGQVFEKNIKVSNQITLN